MHQDFVNFLPILLYFIKENVHTGYQEIHTGHDIIKN